MLDWAGGSSPGSSLKSGNCFEMKMTVLDMTEEHHKNNEEMWEAHAMQLQKWMTFSLIKHIEKNTVGSAVTMISW